MLLMKGQKTSSTDPTNSATEKITQTPIISHLSRYAQVVPVVNGDHGVVDPLVEFAQAAASDTPPP